MFAKGNGAEITRRDLLTLSNLEWLNDEVINFYLYLVCERAKADASLPKVYAFTTFFYPNLIEKGYASVKRWTRKVDIFSYDVLIIPVNLSSVHWCMSVRFCVIYIHTHLFQIIDMKNKTIDYYDSMHGSNNQCLSALQ